MNSLAIAILKLHSKPLNSQWCKAIITLMLIAPWENG